jgi:hypothetical protein
LIATTSTPLLLSAKDSEKRSLKQKKSVEKEKKRNGENFTKERKKGMPELQEIQNLIPEIIEILEITTTTIITPAESEDLNSLGWWVHIFLLLCRPHGELRRAASIQAGAVLYRQQQ